MLRRREKIVVNAVLDEDVKRVISALGIREKFDEGHYKCRVCQDTITAQNLKAIVPSGERIEFVCDRTRCLIGFTIERS